MMGATGKNTAIPSVGSFALVTAMCVGSLFLWAGLPMVWLWIGSKVQYKTHSLSLALLAIAIGIALSIAAVVQVLRWINRKHTRLRQLRGKDVGGLSALEIILVATGAVALAGFFIWFVAFSGTSPVPLNIGY